MVAFRYRAIHADGREIAGIISAATTEEAERLLGQQGLRPVEITAAAPAVRLSNEEAEQFTERIAQLSADEAPLAHGLRAAAAETNQRRLRSALIDLANRLERGQTLEAALAESPGLLPSHLKGLIRAAGGSGKLGIALTELVEHQRLARSLRRDVMESLAYPLLVLTLATLILVTTGAYVIGMHEPMLREFQLKLPLLTEFLFWFRRTGFMLTLVGAAVVALGFGIYRVGAGRAAWYRLMATVPVIGPLWYWTAVAEWTNFLAVLVRHKVALPDALQMAADGVSNPSLGQMSLKLADGAARGRSLSLMLSAARVFPPSLVPFIRWGEEKTALDDALRAGCEVLVKRVRLRSILLQSILPPMLFIAIGCGVFFIVSALFIPLISLIGALS